MSIHEGHRRRVKQEFFRGGLEHFSDLRALELLLFYSRMQGDVNPLAHTLLDTFGSLAGVLDADPDRLLEVPGIGENTAILLKLVPAMGSKYLSCRTSTDTMISSPQEMRNLFTPYFFASTNERFYLAALDGKHKLLGVRKISEGIPTATDVTTRQVVEAALALNATVVILAHNHLSGIATPSDADLQSTAYLQGFLAKMGITLFDHVILVDDDMVSLRENHYL
ncbi:MAG: repair protein RadC [Evtepia sp.]|jgi:DNA repair protein RadC|nr:repair protein RadC [Evtepia sp.]